VHCFDVREYLLARISKRVAFQHRGAFAPYAEGVVPLHRRLGASRRRRMPVENNAARLVTRVYLAVSIQETCRPPWADSKAGIGPASTASPEFQFIRDFRFFLSDRSSSLSRRSEAAIRTRNAIGPSSTRPHLMPTSPISTLTAPTAQSRRKRVSSVMESSIKNGVPGIEAECWVACACARGHVYVDSCLVNMRSCGSLHLRAFSPGRGHARFRL